ncbi:MAG: TRAP transporter substrate-binding protein [Candidatus Eremiobacteraeota bacterium]|nr:TRAP transporter substrate-binding protein [Candidatus Eremiobacteraeota bacterium]
MERKTFIRAAAAGGASAVTAAGFPSLLRAATMTLRFAHYVPADHPAGVAAKQFAERVAARTQGAIAINIFPNNQLGDPPAQAAQIRQGSIDIGLPTQGQLDKYEKAFAAVVLPFVFNDRAEVFKVMDGPVIEWLAPLAAKQGFITLRNWDYGFRNVTNTVRPVNTPDDIKGLKIRTPPEIQIASTMEALGAVVTPISFAELYLALSQKVVDGEENPIATIYYSKFYEVQKYLALTHHIYNNMILTVSAITWNKLSREQQAIFREEGVAAGDLMRKLMGEQENDQIAKLGAAGMQITRPNLAPFRAKMGPAVKKISDYAGAENVDKFVAIVRKTLA